VPGKKDKGHYSLSVAVKAIEWFSEWYGIRMPLPKCDLIAIPEFSMGLFFQIFGNKLLRIF